MDFLKRQAFSIVCVLAAVAGIALLVTGVRAMPRVVEEMKSVEAIHRNLTNLQSGAVSLEDIEALEAQQELVREDREQVFNQARQVYGYEQIVPGVLPAGNALARMDFRRKYITKTEELLQSLHCGRPAGRLDFLEYQDLIAEEEANAQAAGQAGGSAGPGGALGPLQTPAGVLTKAGAKKEARARASLAVAQKIHMYALHWRDEFLPDLVSSLDVSPEMRDQSTAEPPFLDFVWWAQLGYWVQKDIVGAIAAVNDARAAQLREDGAHPWVGNMPVKELISIRLGAGFVPADADEEVFGAPPGGYTDALPPGNPETVFTRSGQSDAYDVIQYTVKAVMDPREIPTLVDRICKNSFHTLLRVSYEAVPVNRSMVGKIYGSGPVVNVVMDFELILLGDVFRALMPDYVCEEFDIACPERAEAEEEGD